MGAHACVPQLFLSSFLSTSTTATITYYAGTNNSIDCNLRHNQTYVHKRADAVVRNILTHIDEHQSLRVEFSL